MRLFQLTVTLGLVLAGVSSQAATIFSTGVSPSGVALALGATDPNYTRTAGNGPHVVVSNPPNAAWLVNSATSQWVDDNGARTLNATESYFTTFTGNGSSDALAFFLGVDNNLTAIVLNGSITVPGAFLTCSCSANFTALTLFQITSGIQAGSNTLEFRLQNIGGDGGFRIASVPEPESFGMALLGGIAVMVSRVRRSRKAGAL